MHKITIAVLFLIAAALVAPPVADAQKKTKTGNQKQPSKNVYEPDAEMLADLKGKVRVVESKKDWAQFVRQSAIDNPDGSRTAYVARFKMKDQPDSLMDVIVVYEKQSKKFYEIRGVEDFAWRLLEGIKWTSADILEFEQWVNPSNGGRYAVNVKIGKIVRAGYVRSN